ncbi:MAG TPA: M61 family peptidase [Candidatus Sulfotelmatobacter sp.]|nr:M61 family peptidase [Candidatus Sulfotelmatobacter sp.]
MMGEFLRRGIFAGIAAVVIFCGSAPLWAETPPGPIKIAVDARQAPQKILHSHLQFPVKPGPLTLYYPQWIPGEHMPDGPIIDLGGLKFQAGGKTIPWRRDLVDMFAFHLEIPPGATSLDADLDFLLNAPASGFSAGASATASLDVLSWNQVLLYPKGYKAHELTFVPSLRLPDGWKYGTALPGAKQNGDTIEFSPVTLNTLVDSPVLAGKYFRVIQLTPGQDPPHELDIAADSQAALEMSPDMQKAYRQLVAETGALFGSRHYRDYHFLVTLSDDVAHFGLEHHESSDDRSNERSLLDEALRMEFSGLLPHEFVHSWNGKFRRPADLSTPDYQQPMKDDLLWVYEGLTEYLGVVLTARSGLLTQEQSREYFAHYAATYEHRPGRDWRPLQDTADAAPFLYDAKPAWSNWRRGVDFYDEGFLLWLDVDANLRRLTNDSKSMNDFCKIFHGGPGGEPALKTYTFEDVVATLNSLASYDWAGFLRTRLDSTSTKTPMEAVENTGWKLVYNERPNEFEEAAEAAEGSADLTFSLGLMVDDDGRVGDVIHGGPSYNAGIGPGMRIAAVNSKKYSPEELKDAVEASKSAAGPIELMIINGAQYRTFPVDYHGGLVYPHVERDASKPDYLSEIFRAMVP